MSRPSPFCVPCLKSATSLHLFLLPTYLTISLKVSTTVVGADALPIIVDKLQEGLTAVDKQPDNTDKYSNIDKGPATYGVVKHLRDNDMELHTDAPV